MFKIINMIKFKQQEYQQIRTQQTQHKTTTYCKATVEDTSATGTTGKIKLSYTFFKPLYVLFAKINNTVNITTSKLLMYLQLNASYMHTDNFNLPILNQILKIFKKLLIICPSVTFVIKKLTSRLFFCATANLYNCKKLCSLQLVQQEHTKYAPKK